MQKNASQMPISFLYMREDLEQDNGHFLVQVQKRSGLLSMKTVHKEYGTILLKGCWWSSQKADVQFPALRAHHPEVDSKVEAMENCRYTIVSTWRRFKLFFAHVNQLSLSGAIAEMCEEYETLYGRSGQPVVVEQSSSSLVLSLIKTEVPLDCDDPANQNFLLQQYGERNEKLSQQDKFSKFSMDAGFLNVVQIGQYFMTKGTAEFSQFTGAVACHEYNLPRDEEASQLKGWIQGNTQIGPVLEIPTCCLHGKYGVEVRIMSMNKDNSHSWVRISHSSIKFVANLNNNEQEIPEVQLKEYALKLDAKDFACRSKAEAKPQRREPAGPFTRTIPIHWKRSWTMSNQWEYSFTLRLCGIEEIDSSSSSWKTSTSRR